jgi:hypothetical protein
MADFACHCYKRLEDEVMAEIKMLTLLPLIHFPVKNAIITE